MDYVFKTEPDFHSGYAIFLRKRLSSTDPWHRVAQIDNKKKLSFYRSIPGDVQDKIKSFAQDEGLM